jgi:predicted ester cyclase
VAFPIEPHQHAVTMLGLARQSVVTEQHMRRRPFRLSRTIAVGAMFAQGASMSIKAVIPRLLTTLPLLGLCLTARVRAENIKAADLVVAPQISTAQLDGTLSATRAFYEFWNTGDVALLNRAIAPTFTDRTLPPGRPQGPEGPAFASHRFRAAVPDLRVKVEKMIVAGSYVTVHMRFTGHFTGTFGKSVGKGQALEFIATDLLKIDNGRITDNWHIEDNLTLLQQMGVATVAS